MTQVTSSTATGQAAADSPETSRCGESRVAHFARDNHTSVCLCGYMGVREATPEEARLSGYCVVCFELRYGFLPPLPYPAPLFRFFHQAGVSAKSRNGEVLVNGKQVIGLSALWGLRKGAYEDARGIAGRHVVRLDTHGDEWYVRAGRGGGSIRLRGFEVAP